MTEVNRSQAALQSQSQNNASPLSVAASLVNQNRDPVLNTAGLRSDLAALQSAFPAQANAMEHVVLAQMSPREQGEFMRSGTAQTPVAANDQGPSTATVVADLTQLTLDLVGIVEPTPFADGSNAIISLGRSIGSAWNGDWGDAGGHLLNGTLSAVGIIPYLGDAAKAGKIGKWAQTVADAVSMAARNPALRATMEAPLKEIQGLVNRIPQGAIDSLPAGARESLERMKSQLDEFFGAGARAADNIPVRQFDNAADFNRAANNAAPNTRYEYGNYSYTTDANGRVSVAEGQIDLTPAGRNDPTLQADIGREGRSTDVGFHMIADRFGGQTNRLNVVAGNGKPIGDGVANLNQGAFKRFENRVADIAAQPGNTVEVRITANYDPTNVTTRPDSFGAQYRVNGGQWRTANNGEPFINK